MEMRGQICREISNQLLKLYHYRGVQPSQASEVPVKVIANEEHATKNNSSGRNTTRPEVSRLASVSGHSNADNDGTLRTTPHQVNKYGTSAASSNLDHKDDCEIDSNQHQEPIKSFPVKDNWSESCKVNQEANEEKTEAGGVGGFKEKYHGRNWECDSSLVLSPQHAVKNIIEDKVEGGLEECKTSSDDMAPRTSSDHTRMNSEVGVEMTAKSEKKEVGRDATSKANRS